MNYDNDLIITKGTLEELTDLPKDSDINDLMCYFEEIEPDSTTLFDSNLECLLDNLLESGLSYKQIKQINEPTSYRYSWLEFYYYINLNIYVLDFLIFKDDERLNN